MFDMYQQRNFYLRYKEASSLKFQAFTLKLQALMSKFNASGMC